MLLADGSQKIEMSRDVSLEMSILTVLSDFIQKSTQKLLWGYITGPGKYMTLWSSDFARSCDKLKSLYLHYQSLYDL